MGSSIASYQSKVGNPLARRPMEESAQSSQFDVNETRTADSFGLSDSYTKEFAGITLKS
jgi:hypothetical protein